MRSKEATWLARNGCDGEVEAIEQAVAAQPLSPDRILAETFDCIEICSGVNGPLTLAWKAAGLRAGPRIDILRFALYDLRDLRLVEWIIFLIERRRLRYVHTAPLAPRSLLQRTRGCAVARLQRASCVVRRSPGGIATGGVLRRRPSAMC